MEVSVGAVGAAFIAGLVSLLGLILGKEQKTSEFRQNWIDALRTQLVNYATNINSIADKLSAGFKNNADKLSSLSPHYAELNKASFDIKLRVNSEEPASKLLLEAMDEFEKLASDEKKFTASNVKPIESRFIEASKQLLKYEWKRVKRGEAPFILAKWIAMIATLAMAAIGLVLILDRPAKAPTSNSPVPGINVECNASALNEAQSGYSKTGNSIYRPHHASQKTVERSKPAHSTRATSCER